MCPAVGPIGATVITRLGAGHGLRGDAPPEHSLVRTGSFLM